MAIFMPEMPACPICKCKSNVELAPNSPASMIGSLSYYFCHACKNSFCSKIEGSQMYIICRDFNDPDVKSIPGPSKTFNSREQAETVARKMAAQYMRTFYVCLVVSKAHIVEATIDRLE